MSELSSEQRKAHELSLMQASEQVLAHQTYLADYLAKVRAIHALDTEEKIEQFKADAAEMNDRDRDVLRRSAGMEQTHNYLESNGVDGNNPARSAHTMAVTAVITTHYLIGREHQRLDALKYLPF